MAKQILLLIMQLLSGYCACCSSVCMHVWSLRIGHNVNFYAKDMKSLFFRILHWRQTTKTTVPFSSRFSFRLRHIIGGSCSSYHFRHDKTFVATGVLLSREKMCFVPSNTCLLRQNFRHDKNDICGGSRQWCSPAPLPPSMTAADNSRRVAREKCCFLKQQAALLLRQLSWWCMRLWLSDSLPPLFNMDIFLTDIVYWHNV